MISSRASVWRFTERQLTSANSVPLASGFCLCTRPVPPGYLLPRCASETAEAPTSALGGDDMWRYMVNLRLHPYVPSRHGTPGEPAQLHCHLARRAEAGNRKPLMWPRMRRYHFHLRVGGATILDHNGLELVAIRVRAPGSMKQEYSKARSAARLAFSLVLASP